MLHSKREYTKTHNLNNTIFIYINIYIHVYSYIHAHHEISLEITFTTFSTISNSIIYLRTDLIHLLRLDRIELSRIGKFLICLVEPCEPRSLLTQGQGAGQQQKHQNWSGVRPLGKAHLDNLELLRGPPILFYNYGCFGKAEQIIAQSLICIFMQLSPVQSRACLK